MSVGIGRTLAGLTVAAAALVSSSEGMMTAHQLKIREEDYTFKVNRFEDQRKTPYRIFFFDHHALTGSSYSFNDSGTLVHFKAGSEVYSEVSVSPAGGGIEFSPQARLQGRNKKDDDGYHLKMDYYWEDFSCHQCLRADHNLCGPAGGELGGLTEFCNAVDLSDLGSEGADSVEILCVHRINTCAKLGKTCDLKCDAGGDAAPLDQDYECIPEFFGDGDCDSTNNHAECGFDFGDCCYCTCMSTSDYHCNHFACTDPEADCVDDDDFILFEGCRNVEAIGNGYCDMENNNEQCGYDGGDCCSCTCVGAPEIGWGRNEYREPCTGESPGFACIDPTAPCVGEDGVTVEMVKNCGFPQGYGNGICDHKNNNELCGYDGGDCCPCTCVTPENNDDEHLCSPHASGFACLDPEAACLGDDDEFSIGNYENELPMGNYDDDLPIGAYGDDTRVGYYFGDGPSTDGFYGADISYGVVDGCGFAPGIGDGFCDNENNNELCGYDGGDCCSCTCDPGENDDGYHCKWFSCIDPSAPCVDDDDFIADMLGKCGNPANIGDGFCHDENNKAECNYDGGDCCECTCEAGESSDDYSGGQWSSCTFFACIDPAAPCVEEDIITTEMAESCSHASGIGNGYCDLGMNNAACAYDGGDCCSCTCETEWDDGYGCLADGSGFDCKDPSAPCFGEERTIS